MMSDRKLKFLSIVLLITYPIWAVPLIIFDEIRDDVKHHYQDIYNILYTWNVDRNSGVKEK